MNHSETITIECTINGIPFQLHAAPGTPLSELLREQGLLSVKQGCCVGECGACTVLVDGIEVGHGSGDSKKEAEQHAAFSVAEYMTDEQCASLLDRVDRLTQ